MAKCMHGIDISLTTQSIMSTEVHTLLVHGATTMPSILDNDKTSE